MGQGKHTEAKIIGAIAAGGGRSARFGTGGRTLRLLCVFDQHHALANFVYLCLPRFVAHGLTSLRSLRRAVLSNHLLDFLNELFMSSGCASKRVVLPDLW